MIGSWLTTRAVYVFGALLILVGLIFIVSGVPIVRLEIGWTEIIGGAVAASAGCVILVLGLFLARLETLQETLDRLAPAPAIPVFPPVALAPDPDRVFEPASTPAMHEPAPDVAADEIAPVRYPVVHPLAPGGRRERFASGVADVKPEPALAVAAPNQDGDESPAVDPPEAPALTVSAPALLHAEEEASHPPAVEPFEPVEAAKRSPGFMSSLLSRRLMAGMPRREREPERAGPREPVLRNPDLMTVRPTLRRSMVDLSSGWDGDSPETSGPAGEQAPAPLPVAAEPPYERQPFEPEPEDLREESAPAIDLPPDVVDAAHEEGPAPPAVIHAPPPPAPEPPAAASEPDPAQPVVVGRYNAGSASYVMYSNGMIEVETEQGTHQFASMQELKAFIERRDTAGAY